MPECGVLKPAYTRHVLEKKAEQDEKIKKRACVWARWPWKIPRICHAGLRAGLAGV